MPFVSPNHLIALLVVIWVLSAQAADTEFPDWLGGTPDVAIKPDRCGVYEWFLDEADRQTQGVAAKDDLASKRVINVANKLVDHHRVSPADGYSAQVRYLVFGDHGPFHFSFDIGSAELDSLLSRRCDG